MYQPYPSSDSNKTVEPERPPAPPSVVNAVKLMYAGAAVSTVSLVVTLADLSGIKSSIQSSALKSKTKLTMTQIHQLENFIVILSIVSGVLGIVLWLWMARQNSQGKGWARIVATVLFGLATVDMLGVFTQPKALLSFLFPVITWVVGLVAVILLWRRDASDFFRPKAAS